jgi:hypothetical protein
MCHVSAAVVIIKTHNLVQLGTTQIFYVNYVGFPLVLIVPKEGQLKPKYVEL